MGLFLQLYLVIGAAIAAHRMFFFLRIVVETPGVKNDVAKTVIGFIFTLVILVIAFLTMLMSWPLLLIIFGWRAK